jgi:lipopolysaccharide/colanic/teichoic acid biosynthesis glycosyltransferase
MNLLKRDHEPVFSAKPRHQILKRSLDLLLSTVGLLLSAPLWGIAALAVKLEDRGPVF